MTVQEQYNRQRRRVTQLVRRAAKRGYVFRENIIPQRPNKITKSSVEKLAKLTPEAVYKKAKYVDPETGKTVKGVEGRKLERTRAAKKAAETVRTSRSISGKGIAKSLKPSKSLGDYRAAYHGENDGASAGSESEDDEKPQETDIVLENLAWGYFKLRMAGQKIRDWQPSANWTESLKIAKENDKNIVAKILKGAIDAYGERQLAIRLQYEAEDIISLLDEILYGSGDKEGNFKDGQTKVNADINKFATILKGSPLNMYESIAATTTAEENETEY